MCYKLINGEVSLHCNLLDLSDLVKQDDINTNCITQTVLQNAYKYIFL